MDLPGGAHPPDVLMEGAHPPDVLVGGAHPPQNFWKWQVYLYQNQWFLLLFTNSKYLVLNLK